MARLALSVVGAGIGALFGAPQLGWLIGSAVGGILFPPSGPDVTVEGPRLGDLTVTSSAYGAAIPKGYGTIRMSANMIWSTGIEEVKNVDKQSSGGKGGGGATQTTITYEYFGTFAMAFAEGPADDVLRMWADGKLIYDKTGTSDDIQKIDLKFRFYSGSETQTPDSLILADKGASETPAHRGLCYIVFERLPLKDFGNRIPNITAEITFNQSVARNETVADFYTTGEGGIADSYQNDELLPDFARGVFYGVDQGDFIIRRFNIRTMAEDRQSQLTNDTNGNPVSNLGLEAVMPNGYVIFSTTGGNTQPLIAVDPNSLQPVGTFGVASNDLGTSPTGFEAASHLGKCSWVKTGGGQVYYLHGSLFNSVGLLDVTNGQMNYVWDNETAGFTISESRVKGTCAGATGTTFGEAYVMVGPRYATLETGDVRIFKLTVNNGATYDANSLTFTGTSAANVVTLSPNDIIPGEVELGNCLGPIYDETDDTIMIQAQAGSDLNEYWMLKIDPSDGSILWRTEITDTGVPIRNSIMGWNHGRIVNGTYGQMSGVDSFALRTSDGEIVFTASDWTRGYTSSGAGWWDGKTNTFIGYDAPSDIVKWLFFRGDGQGDALSDVVTDICAEVGLAASDIDVTELAALTVPGYTIGRQVTARSAIEQLASIYFFDGVESDYTLKFTLRDGKSSSASIVQDDLAAIDNETGEFIREIRIQEVELPRRFTLTYMSSENDYQQQAHSSQRVVGPSAFQTSYSDNAINLPVPIVLDSDTAKQTVEKALISSWTERVSIASRLSWEFISLDPNDVVTITLDSGTVYRVRLTQTDIGLDFAMDLSALAEDAAQYTSTVTGDSGTGPLVQEFLSELTTKLIVLCSPLLRDSHDVSRVNSKVYTFMGGYGQPGWNAATLFRSSDNVSWDEAGSNVAEMTWGTCSTALGDTDLPYQTDNTNTVTVFLSTNTDAGLDSITSTEMLNGGNAAAIISADGRVEIFQFQTASLNTDGSYTLSVLLRGRRGTESFTGIHAVGDIFLLLEDAPADQVNLSLAEVDTTLYYRAVTSGTMFEDADNTSKASPGRDLMPYRPVQLDLTSGTWGSDVVLEWVRQTRIGGFGLVDGTDDVPLAEDSEEYEIEIYTPGGTLVRTYTGLASNAATYSSGDQTTDSSSWTGFQDETANLLTNASFETLTTNAGGAFAGWTVETGSSAVAILTGADGSIIGAQDGDNYMSFAEATDQAAVEVNQTIDISVMADIIDQGNLQIRGGVYINSDTTDTDTGRIDLVWLDADDNVLQTDSGMDTAPTSGSWTQITTTGTAPNNARQLRVELHGTRNNGTALNVAMDTVTLEIDEGTKQFLHFKVYQVSAQVGRGFPSVTGVVDVGV